MIGIALSIELDSVSKRDNLPKDLPLSFEGRGEVKGFLFRQVKRSNTAYLFEVSDTFGNIWYEVFKRKEDSRFGKIAYPKSKSFGISAWTCATIEKAEFRYSSINDIKHEI